MSELKPCPFCGEQSAYVGYTRDPFSDNRYAWVNCGKCHSSGGQFKQDVYPGDKLLNRDEMESEAIKRWNTRPIEDALNKRIAELSQAVGLITTLKPTMVMDANHPLDMVREVAEHVTARIAELEAEKCVLVDQQREAKNHLIDKNLHIDSLYEEGYKLQQRIAELEEQVWDLNLANERLESAYFADETIAPDGSLKPSVCKLMKRVEKAETDYSISEAHVTALLNRIAELEAAQRWIPVSERLPDTKIVYDKFDVIVEFENIKNGGTTRCVELMSYDYRNKSWNDDCGEYGFYPVAGVTHWRERPTLPEVE